MFLRACFLIAAAFSLDPTFLRADENPSVQVTEQGDKLLIQTSQGSRSFDGNGDFGALKDYRVRVKLSDLSRKPTILQAAPLAPSLAGAVAAPSPPASSVPSPIDSSVISAVDKTSALLDEINSLYFEGRYADALVKVDALLAANPKQLRAWQMKGSLYEIQGQHAAAEEAWQKAKALVQGDPQ